MLWDSDGQLKPRGSPEWETGRSVRFSRICPFSPLASDEDQLSRRRFPSTAATDARIGRYDAAYVGHVSEADFRLQGSSGGMSTWVAAELLRRGLVDGVAHVVPVGEGGDPRFAYRISRSTEQLREGAKSRYYPIHMGEILQEMKSTPGRYAVIGIPCFIKAVHLLRAQDQLLRERVAYTLGLFCGHMKSARFVDSFAWQLGVEPEDVARVEYRKKDAGRPANWYTAGLTLRDGRQVSRDWWHLVDGDWGAGFFQNSACNYCDDVVAETADIVFGDAWVEPYSSDGRGTNVVIVRSRALLEIVEQARGSGRLTLQPVDTEFIVRTQEAGLRHRREGLAYRLTWKKRGLVPRKRVVPMAAGLSWRRKLVYRTRAAISRWSHIMARLARTMAMPRIYTVWARTALGFYQGLTYSRGIWGRLFDRLERRSGA
jgi:coenzyme F420-reducing hydrogenase beta subunit